MKATARPEADPVLVCSNCESELDEECPHCKEFIGEEEIECRVTRLGEKHYHWDCHQEMNEKKEELKKQKKQAKIMKTADYIMAPKLGKIVFVDPHDDTAKLRDNRQNKKD